MKYASLKYNISMSENEIEETQSHQKRIKSNIGDNIQSIATEQFLPIVDKRFNRDALNQVHENEKFLLIMNGWYTHMPENWPPSESIIPVFIGFHITESYHVKKLLLSDESISYYKRNEPIGCRDKKTAELLSDRGVKTYYSKCLTLTFPKREYEPQNGKVFLVDVEDIPIPKNLEQGSLSLTHIVPRFISDENKILIAKQILDKLQFRIQAVLRSRKSKYILMNVPNEKIPIITKILPVLKSPTVMPLSEAGWSSLHSVIEEDTFWEVIDQLKEAGAEGILVCPIEKMVL